MTTQKMTLYQEPLLRLHQFYVMLEQLMVFTNIPLIAPNLFNVQMDEHLFKTVLLEHTLMQCCRCAITQQILYVIIIAAKSNWNKHYSFMKFVKQLNVGYIINTPECTMNMCKRYGHSEKYKFQEKRHKPVHSTYRFIVCTTITSQPSKNSKQKRFRAF